MNSVAKCPEKNNRRSLEAGGVSAGDSTLLRVSCKLEGAYTRIEPDDTLSQGSRVLSMLHLDYRYSSWMGRTSSRQIDLQEKRIAAALV